METLIAFAQHHGEQSLGYWAAIRLVRLALQVNRIEREQRFIIAHLNRTYQDNRDS